MTAADWPAGDPRLERHYRRLLLAYPGPYRRHHGAEIVTTLLEMAGPGRSRPAPGEAWHLVTSGLRQRFRLPGRPLVLLTAALVTAVTAVLGAAAGSWAGERTFAALPPRAAVQRLLTTVLPDADPSQNLPPFRLGRPGFAYEYQLSGTPAAGHPGTGPADVAAPVRDRIAAAGWTVTSFVVEPPYPHPETAEAGTYFTAANLVATHDGLILSGRMDYQYNRGQYYLGGFSGQLFAQRSAAYLPLTAGGGLLGLLAGWLLAAALAYRLRSMPTGRRRTVSLLAGAALVTAAAPVFAIARQVVPLAVHFGDPRFPVSTLHSVLREGMSVPGPQRWLIPVCTIAAPVLGALAAVVVRVRTRATAAPRLVATEDEG